LPFERLDFLPNGFPVRLFGLAECQLAVHKACGFKRRINEEGI